LCAGLSGAERSEATRSRGNKRTIFHGCGLGHETVVSAQGTRAGLGVLRAKRATQRRAGMVCVWLANMKRKRVGATAVISGVEPDAVEGALRTWYEGLPLKPPLDFDKHILLYDVDAPP